MSNFRFYSRLILSLESDSSRKNLFLNVGCCWEGKLSIHEMDEKKKVESLIVATCTWKIYFAISKLLENMQNQLDAAGAAQ